MSGYYYGDMWIGYENAARLGAMEQRMEPDAKGQRVVIRITKA